MTHSQKPGPMCEASQLLSQAIAERRLAHPDDEELNRHVLSAAAKFYRVGWRFVKPKGKSLPIDGAVALAMAIRVLRATELPAAETRPGARAAVSAVTYT
jgi:hypothetical protein